MIQVTKLEKQYQGKTVLAGLDMCVMPGEFVVLQGANGAGKTTLIRILSTLTRPSAGDFTIGGTSGLRDPEGVRSQIGVMLHQPMIYGDLSAVENLRFFADLSGKRDFRMRILAGLEQVGLNPDNQKPVRHYSRGMQQRLSIARALLSDPAYLLLDEPFTGLDTANQARLMDLLKDLQSKGRALLVTDHDPARVAQMATRVDYLYHGRIEQTFSGSELEANYLGARIAAIEGGTANDGVMQEMAER